MVDNLRAQELEPDLIALSKSEKWHKYLHLNSNGMSRIKADSNFFLAEDGFKNPLAELKASIATFISPEIFLRKNIGHPNCLFPARLKLIKQKFKIVATDINCPAYTNWLKNTKTSEIQIVFASQFVNNPASVMGHTFLKFKKNDTSDYLNLYLGYAAEVPDNTSPLKYFYYGLTGGFPGIFSVGPYYQKVFEYNDIEQRDIWEYTLNLTNEQKEYLADHVWELENTAKFGYYFFDRNCSYMLLDILNTIVDGQNLLPKSPFVIPHETLKLLDRRNLLLHEKFLPSIRTKLVHKFQLLSQVERQQVLHVISTKHLSTHENINVLDTLIDYNLIEFQRGKKLDSEFKDTAFSRNVLIARSKDNKITNEMENIANPPSPLATHSPHQLSLSIGNQNNGKTFYSLIFKPGIHQQMDKSDGFIANTSFSFLSPEIRYKQNQKKLYLNSFKLINFSSINPYTPIDPQLSWGLLVSIFKNESNECPNCSMFNTLIYFGYNLKKSGTTSYNFFPSLEFRHKFSLSQADLFVGGIAEYIYELKKIKFLISESIQQPIRAYDTSPVFYSTNLNIRFFDIFTNNDLESKILIKNFSSKFKSYVELSLGYVILW